MFTRYSKEWGLLVLLLICNTIPEAASRPSDTKPLTEPPHWPCHMGTAIHLSIKKWIHGISRWSKPLGTGAWNIMTLESIQRQNFCSGKPEFKKGNLQLCYVHLLMSTVIQTTKFSKVSVSGLLKTRKRRTRVSKWQTQDSHPAQPVLTPPPLAHPWSA